MVKHSPFSPSRRWRKNAGPGESRVALRSAAPGLRWFGFLNRLVSEPVVGQQQPRSPKIAPEPQADCKSFGRSKPGSQVGVYLLCLCRVCFVLHGDMRLPRLPILRCQPGRPLGGEAVPQSRDRRHAQCVGRAAAQEAEPGNRGRAGRRGPACLVEMSLDCAELLPGKMVEHGHMGRQDIERGCEVALPEPVEVSLGQRVQQDRQNQWIARRFCHAGSR